MINRRINRMAVRRRAALVVKLGGRCVQESPECNGKLTIDHIAGRDYRLETMASHMRVKRYEEEAERGELQVLCWYHNRKKGKYDGPKLR